MQPLFQNACWRAAFCWLALALLVLPAIAQEDPRGKSVVVVYNSAMPESKAVADHYAALRKIPAAQVFGFDLPREEEISREVFTEKLQRPLWRKIKEAGLIRYSSGGELGRKPVEPKIEEASIRYLVLCYGVPVKIARESGLNESAAEKLPAELQPRNEAAVDSELALLPSLPAQPLLAGPLGNPVFGQTNQMALSPMNGILLTARLDGPSAELAKGLVDKAIQAEKQGLWGRGYFDLRGLNDDAYKMGDSWIESAAKAAAHFGYETEVDRAGETFPAGFPMSDIALYFGWYEQSITGPFSSGLAEFAPGAIAYHLHSFSASVLRSPSTFWVGPLVARGVSATFGFTEEPYLQFTPEVHVFLARMLFQGFSFGEAAYAAQRYLSWQTTVVGDPLYIPNLVPPQERFLKMKATDDPLLPWAQLLIVNRNAAMNFPVEEAISYIEKTPGVGDHYLLQEKLGELYKKQGMVIEAAEPFLKAIEMEPPPLDKLRLALNAGGMLSNLGHKKEVYALFQEILRKFPNYPDKTLLYRRLADLAASLDKKEEAAEYTRLAEAPAG